MTRLQLGDRIPAVFLGSPLRVAAWGVALFTGLGLAAGWWVAVYAIAAGAAGAAVWWAGSKWRCRP